MMMHSSLLMWVLITLLSASVAACRRQTPITVTEGYVPIESGLRLYYRAIGTSPETVIVPGASWWPRDIDRLAVDRTVVLYDTRGRGRSDAVPDSVPVGIPQEIMDLERLREHLAISRVSLVGWSYLGAVVVLYAAQHPEHVNRIVQIGSIVPVRNPYWDQWLADYAARSREGSVPGSGPSIADCRTGIRAMVIPQLGDTSFADIIADTVGCGLPNEHPKALGHLLQRMTSSLGDWDWRPQAASVAAPVLTVHGTRDNVPLEASREWVSALQDARLLRMEGVGHYPMYERPDVFLRALERFFDGAWPENAEEIQ